MKIMRRFTTFFALILFVCNILNAQSFSGGTGVAGDPYQISTKAELIQVSSYPNFYYILNNDIDFTGDAAYTSGILGNFAGDFDGKGHIISNITFEGSLSLFTSITTSGKVKNLHVRSLTFTEIFYSNGSTNTKNQYHAPFAYTNNGLIENCSYKGSVRSYSRASGFVLNNNGTIKNCYSNAIVSAYDGVNISYNTFPGRYAGGFVITNGASGIITNCYSANEVSVGDYGAGGFAYENAGQISNCFSLVQSVKSTWYSSTVHRFTNSNTGILSNNYALNTMILNSAPISNTDPSSIEAADITSTEIADQTTYTGLGWNFSRNWVFEEGKTYPTLRILVDCPVIELSDINASAQIGVNYTQTITAIGGASPYTFELKAGSLPDGLSLSPDGEITGLPTTVESTNFTVKVTDNNGCEGEKNYAIQIGPVTMINNINESDLNIFFDSESKVLYLKNELQKIIKLSCYNTSGTLIFDKYINNNQCEFKVSLAKGVYILYIEQENNCLARKIIKN